MAGGQAVWGIDVGKCALKAVRLRAADDEKVELLASDYIAHAKILSQPDANRDELVANALEKFLSRNDITNDQVVVAVPGQHTLARFSKLPPVDDKKIPEIVRYEADQQIPFDIDEVIWDFQTFKEEESPELEVGIFAMKRELIREYLMHFENAGIEPIVVQAAPLALYNTAASDGLLGDGTTTLLDIGAENTDLVVCTPHSLWTRTIPLGGNNFTEALVKSFKLSFSKAENLKQSAASSKYARQIFQAMRPIFADLVQELQRSIGFYTSTHREAKISKCLAMGNAFKLPGLQKYLQQNLSITVERPDSFKMIHPSAAVNAPQFAEQLLSFGVAYGLAIQGLGLGRISSSLLPAEIAKQAVWRKKLPFFGAAAACLLLAAGVVWMRQTWDMNALQANRGNAVSSVPLELANEIISDDLPAATPSFEYAQTIAAAADSLRREWRGLTRQGTEEVETIEQIQRLQQNKALMLRLYQVIHDALPPPQDPLRAVETPDDYATAVQSDPNGLQRGKRTEVFIEELDVQYDPDVNGIALDDVSGSELDELEITTDMTTEGFIVTLRCRTPNRGGVRFVSDVFMNRLRQMGREPRQGFFINRVVLTSLEPLAKDETPAGGFGPPPGSPPGGRGTPGRSPRGGRGGEEAGAGGRIGGGFVGGGRTGRARGGGRRGGPPKPPPGGVEGAYIDPITNEAMDHDWLFNVEFDVLLNDAPEPEPDEEEDRDTGQ
jgi:type IV pilus assembly protein PilM